MVAAKEKKEVLVSEAHGLGQKALENVELPASEIENDFGTDTFESVEPEKKKRISRQSKKSESERAIDEVKALVALKLSVQRGRREVIENDFGMDTFESVEPEKKKRISRQSKKSESERAIDEVKALVALKLSVQRGRRDVANVKPLLEKLFSNEDITEEEAEQLLTEIDSLGSYVKLRQEYRAAREKARPALKMFEEAGLSEDDAPTLE